MFDSRKLRVLSVLVALLAMIPFATGCASGEIKQEVGDDGKTDIGDGTVKDVCSRFSEYVKADTTLDENAKAQALADVAVVTMAFKQEKVPAAPIAVHLFAVCDAHDRYVKADPKLSASWKDLALTQTKALRKLFNATMGVPKSQPAVLKPVAATPAVFDRATKYPVAYARRAG